MSASLPRVRGRTTLQLFQNSCMILRPHIIYKSKMMPTCSYTDADVLNLATAPACQSRLPDHVVRTARYKELVARFQMLNVQTYHTRLTTATTSTYFTFYHPVRCAGLNFLKEEHQVRKHGMLSCLRCNMSLPCNTSLPCNIDPLTADRRRPTPNGCVSMVTSHYLTLPG